ncbi:hypothetical protein GCM10023311_19100 [Flaviramulus aquimarinus]|uniref:VanZ-like domain-containing protein n=1 Tax=Flaviramulus aquimarinus TaxID=1170456 RepID=A0ABP9F582_9FLAO
MLRILALLLALAYTVVLTLACLMTIKNMPDLVFSLSDKVLHFLAYSILTFLWFISGFHTFKFTKKQAIIYALIFSIVYGILIEVLQGTITVSRAYDVYDMLANSLGAILTSTILWFKNGLHVKNT